MLRRRRLFSIALVVLSSVVLGRDDRAAQPVEARRVSATWSYAVAAGPNTERFRFTLALPRNIPNRQIVRALKFSPEPTRKESEGGNEYAVWDIQTPPPGMSILVELDVELLRADLPTREAAARSSGVPAKPKSFDAWLKSEKYIETDSQPIQTAAARIVGDGDVSVVRSIHDFVQRRLKPGTFVSEDRGAAWALENRAGDCSEYTDLFVALCRARGIPAFAVEGYVTTNIRDNDTPKHSWAEVYLQDVGWVSFDLFHTAHGSAAFDRLDPTRILTSVRRNDPKLDGYHHWQYRYWGDPVEVKDAFTITQR